MTTTSATAWTDNMNLLYSNSGGAIQQLPPVTEIGGKPRAQLGRITLASQASGTCFHVARIPLGAMLTNIQVQASVSLGSSTLAFGDYSGAANIATATTYTTAYAKQAINSWANMLYTEYTVGYDAVTGAVSYSSPGQGGALYEDILMTIGAASLPSSGKLFVITEYIID